MGNIVKIKYGISKNAIGKQNLMIEMQEADLSKSENTT